MRSALAVALLAAACGGSKSPPATAPAPAGDEAPPVATPAPAPAAPGKPVTNRSLASIGLDPDALDRTADPCDDFYQFACGGWIANKQIDADKPMAQRSFVEIEDRNLAYEHGVLERLRATPGDDPVNKQLAAYYGSCMDEAAIEKAGLSPVKPLLGAIDKVKDGKSLSAALAQLHAAGFDLVFDLGPTQDSVDATQVIIGLDQGGLGLPDRDYYLGTDEQSKLLKTAYEGYVAAMLVELGHKANAAKQEAADIVALETELAKVSKDKVARRDPKGMYNRLEKAGLAKAAPSFDWTAFWKAQGLDKETAVTVAAPDFFAGFDKLIASTKPAVWRNYLAVHLLSKAAGSLTKKIEETQFKFYAALTGQTEMEARWKRCVGRTDSALGDLLGQVFVRDRFAGASKSAAEEQVHAIVAAMAANLDALPWMDATTKAKAKTKLAAMTYQIGYPKKWKQYPFKIDAKKWGESSLAARKWETARKNAKIGKPVDKDDWYMSVPSVNAYYDPQQNVMVFPAGILQPPFYSVDASIPVNLGAMGVVVGHELTHGFDDQGAQFDAVGNLANWWQPDTEKAFKARTKCVIDQYEKYEVIGGGHLNGANTVGENIADIGGVKLALAGYRALRAPAPDTVVADGFTEDQQFFLGFGQAWCAKMRPDFEKLLATIDVHSPPKWRVNGTLSATPEFAKAFRCKATAKLAPANACVVW
ncbi:MAG: M13 family metallopeptidase [Myxococcales bacterium]|nr:M13 family metallopeptidase [Myxococcales bacterium]